MRQEQVHLVGKSAISLKIGRNLALLEDRQAKGTFVGVISAVCWDKKPFICEKGDKHCMWFGLFPLFQVKSRGIEAQDSDFIAGESNFLYFAPRKGELPSNLLSFFSVNCEETSKMHANLPVKDSKVDLFCELAGENEEQQSPPLSIRKFAIYGAREH